MGKNNKVVVKVSKKSKSEVNKKVKSVFVIDKMLCYNRKNCKKLTII